MRSSPDFSISLLAIIRYLIFMGDSLSDRGTFHLRKILYGIIPNNALVDLSKSPDGRFTNGFTWDDYLCEQLVSDFLAAALKKAQRKDSTDLADAVIDRDPSVEPLVQAEDTLSSDTKVDSLGERLARTFCEGGLTAHDYSHEWSWHPTLMVARKTVATLDGKCELLLQSDKELAINDQEKKETLVCEWSGGNDFITVNVEPTNEEADKAVAARMANIEKLYAAGYRNFVLGNLPDISATPRYQDKNKYTDAHRKNASEVTDYFNQQLAQKCEAMKKKYRDLSLNIFDAHSAFAMIYNDPGKYGLDPKKKDQPYTTSKDFILKDGTSPAPGYLFWDDIHPTAHMHALLSVMFAGFVRKLYNFKPPIKTNDTDPEHMVRNFMRRYHNKLESDKHSFWSLYGMWNTAAPKLPHDVIESPNDYPRILADILYHGLNEDGTRTLQILKELKWVDKSNKIITADNPALVEAEKIYKFRVQSQPALK